MALIDLQNISIRFSGLDLFTGLHFSLAQNDKCGIIGANGSGKSTLMKLITGRMTPDSGQVVKQKHLKVAFVEQSPAFKAGENLTESIATLLKNEAIDEHDLDLRAQKYLSQCGFEDFTVTALSLSGGWQKRLQMAAAMCIEADVYMLDEPTNHLDVVGVEWLEGLLKKQIRTWMCVSHDRMFLDRTVNQILEVNPIYDGGTFVSKGDYTQYLDHRDAYLEALHASAAKLAGKVRREEEWLSRGPKARSTKAKGRIDQAVKLQEEFATLKKSLQPTNTQLDFVSSGRKTKNLIRAEGVSAKRGDKILFSALDLIVRPKTIMGILGPNGCGKTTLLETLAGKTPPHAGRIIHADDLKIAYYDQHRIPLTGTLQTALCEEGDAVTFAGRSIHVTTWARRFRFKTDQLLTQVQDLSGGEKARVALARLMLQACDVLILDEPTNDLDIPAIEVLEDTLRDFEGAVILVTHDRYLMSHLCDLYLGFLPQGTIGLFASTQQWSDVANPKEVKTQKTKEKPAKKAPQATKKLGFLEQREYDGMESAIQKLEEEVLKKEQSLLDPQLASQPLKLAELYDELEKTRTEVTRLYSRWQELESKITSDSV